MRTATRTDLNPNLRPIAQASAIKWVLSVSAAWRSRRALRNLEPHLLADIGLTAADIAAEQDTPIWDVPKAWRR